LCLFLSAAIRLGVKIYTPLILNQTPTSVGTKRNGLEKTSEAPTKIKVCVGNRSDFEIESDNNKTLSFIIPHLAKVIAKDTFVKEKLEDASKKAKSLEEATEREVL